MWVALAFRERADIHMSPSDAVIGWISSTGEGHVGGYKLKVQTGSCVSFDAQIRRPLATSLPCLLLAFFKCLTPLPAL